MMRIPRRPSQKRPPTKASEPRAFTPAGQERACRWPHRRPRRQAGFTLIELLIAGALLVFGIMTMAGLVGLTVKNNGHSRLDSTATMLNQAVVEQLINGINNKEIKSATTAKITDCNGGAGSTDWNIDSDGPGAPLDSKGNIDFTDTSFTENDGYHMNYAVCGGGRQVIYDVRWNIKPMVDLSGTGTAYTSILTVGSRIKGGPAIVNFPINMRVMVGPDPTSETPGGGS